MPPTPTDSSWRLVLILRDLGVGGAERVTVRLANFAAKNGIATHLIALVDVGPLEAELDARVNFHNLAAKRIGMALWPLYRKLFKLRPDTIMATLPQVNAITIAVTRFLPRKPKVVLREANDPRFESPYVEQMAKWTSSIVQAAYRRADRVIAVSEGVREGLIQRYALSSEQVAALPNASIDDSIYSQAKVELNDGWYSRLDRRIVCVARFAAQKDHQTLLKAFAHIPRSDRRGIGLVLLGGGPLESEIREKIESLDLNGSVKIITGDSNPYRWLKSADLLVLSSRWEGSPNVLIEALALGVPVVSTDCPSGPRELLADGRFGELVPVGDVEALSRGLIRAINKEVNRGELKERGMDFHIDRVGAAWLEELEPV